MGDTVSHLPMLVILEATMIVVYLQSYQWEKRFEEQNMKVPNAKPLLGYKGNLPYFLVDDATFPVKTWLMRPYPRTLIITSKGI